MNTAFFIALRYLSARKLRAVLTTLAVVFGVAVIFAGNLVLPSAIDAFRRASQGAVGAVDLSISSATGGAFAPEPALGRAAAVAGVKAATGSLQRTISVPVGGTNGQAVVIGVDPTTVSQVRAVQLAEGRFLQAADRDTVVFGGEEAKVGSTISLPTVNGIHNYTVVGKLNTGGIPSADVYMTLTDAQTALGVPGQISTIELATQPGVDRAKVEADVLAALGSGFQAGARSAADSFASLDIAYAMFNMLGALALFIGAFLIFNTFRTIVLERKRDLAMLRAIGAERGQVTAILTLESLIQGVLGSVLGLAVGALLTLALTAAMRSVIGRFYAGLDLVVEFTWTAAIPALVAGIVTTLIAGYLPARAAGKLSPLEALRPATTDESQKAARWNLIIGAMLIIVAIGLLFGGPQAATGGAILFLIGLAVASPALIAPVARLFAPLLSTGFAGEGEIAEGNLRRQPGRAAVTASTLMIGLATMVMIGSIIDSFSALTINLFNKNFASDIMVVPQNIALIGANLGAGNQLADSLRQVAGVQTVGTLRTASGTIAGKAINVNGIDPAAYPIVSPLTFSQGDEPTAFAALAQGRTAIANPIFATAQKLHVGDMLTLATPNGPQQYTIAGIAGDALNFKINTLFVSQQSLETDFGVTNDVLLMLKLAPGADLATVQQQVKALAANYPQFSVSVTADFRQQLIDASLTTLQGAFIPLALVILLPAALGLLNTLTMSVLERTREIGITRAIGASRGQVRRIVVAEALLLGLFGATLGALAGLAMSYGFTAAIGSSFGIALPFSLPLLGITAAIVLGLGLTLLVSALPARAAARLDILQALRYE